jgi:hypothetical protein
LRISFSPQVYEAAAEVIGAALFERDEIPDRDLTVFETPLQQRLVPFDTDCVS